MTIDLFRVSHGLAVEADDSSSEIYILQGSGAPGGDAAEQDAAPIGSLFLRTDAETDALQLYYKWSTAGSSAADWKQSTNKEYVDAIAAGLSWREPVLVRDGTTYATIAAAEAAADVADTVDGVTISVGTRILYTDLTTGNENVYIVSGSSGSWTLTEDSNAATDGDALLVQDGSSAEQQWVFDGTNWVQFGSSGGAAELGYIRAFIGKTGAGSELPSYTDQYVITTGDNLEVAISKLDTFSGDGTITNTGGNYAISDDLAAGGANGAAGTLSVTDAVDELNSAVGDRTYTEDNFVTDGESVASSIDAIDIALGDIDEQNSSFQVVVPAVTQTVVDSIAVAAGDLIKWMIVIEDGTTSTKRTAYEILAVHDGAGNVDSTKYANLRLGSKIAGLDVVVEVNTGNLELLVTANGSVDVGGKRLGIVSAN